MNKRKFSRWLNKLKPVLISVVTLMIAKVPTNADTSLPLYVAQATPVPERDLPSTPLPPATPLPERQQPPVTPLPPVEDFLDTPPNRVPPGEVPESEVEFEVKKFVLQGNTVLKEADLEAIFQDYRDRPLTFADLLELETRLTELYTDKGYINSGVVIPAQNIDGEVVLQAIEGNIETINVNVDGRLEDSYIRSRLARGTKSPLNIEELQEALQLLQLDPLIDSINAELSVGLTRERWNLDVNVNQGNAFDPVLFVNNSRTPSVGSFQRGIELNHNNVLGYADRFSFVFRDTDGSDDYDTSYTIPVNSSDGTVGLRYRYVDSDIIEGTLEEENIESQTDEFELTLRQPLLRTANSESTKEFALGIEFSRLTNEVTIAERAFPDISPGADADGETKISALRFFQDWTRRTRKDVFAARSQLSAGLDIFDATENVGAPDGKFVSWRGQVQWLRQLEASSNINLLLRSDVQLSSDDLVPLERFSLGGIYSVRGYRQDALLGDSGIFTSAEVRIPFYRWSNEQNSISAIPFVDFGTTWSNSEEGLDEDTLVSLGVGVRLDLSNTLNARVDYGIPLIDVSDTDNTLQENGVYFSLEYFPF